MLGLGLSIPQVAARGSRSLVAAIRSLFAANEPGVWYDPSDFSTMFQDTAGTTPVTAVEQPVGLMLDKSKGLVLGPELVTNGDFSNGTTGWTAGTGVTQSVVGGYLQVVAGDVFGSYQVVTTIAGKWYEVRGQIAMISGGTNARIRAESGTVPGPTPLASSSAVTSTTPTDVVCRFLATATSHAIYLCVETSGSVGRFDNISVRELPGNHAYQTTTTSRPVLSARVNQYLATETLATQNVTTLAAQYRLSFEGTGTITLSGTATGAYSAGSHLITCTAGTLTSTVSGSVTKADLRVANDGANLPPYQRVNTATDYDTAGFPHYLRFDGVDDWLVTNTITPGTDKVQVFAGVRKLNIDSPSRVVVELSDSSFANNGTFGLFAPTGLTTDSYALQSRGTVLTAPVASRYISPITNILTGLANISNDSAILRVNGTQAASSTLDQGAGNFLAYPLYIGRRGGTTFQFNGHLYSLIVRFGSNLPIETIEKIEKYVNTKTRAY